MTVKTYKIHFMQYLLKNLVKQYNKAFGGVWNQSNRQRTLCSAYADNLKMTK